MADDLKCVMDPVLIEPFDSGTCIFDPPVRIDSETIVQGCDLIVLSHAHADHFSVPSLALFERDTVVLYPAGSEPIERALSAMGFRNARGLAVGDRVDVRGVKLLATPSLVPFPEIGVMFECGGRRLWNLVDSVIDERVIDAVLNWSGRPDLLLANYQPLLEGAVVHNALGGDFPLDEYGRCLRNVARIGPRYVAASACGFRFANDEWLNDRMFPVTESRFARDIAALDGDIASLTLPHGGLARLADRIEVDPDGQPGIERLEARLHAAHDWRPERGVPPLTDKNRAGYDPLKVRAELAAFLERDFLLELVEYHADWLTKMQAAGVVWRLEIRYPDDGCETRLLRFEDPELAWSDYQEEFVDLHTTVAASAALAVLRGDMNGHAFWFNNIRVAHRLFEVAAGVRWIGDRRDEPMSRVLLRKAGDRYLERELARVT